MISDEDRREVGDLAIRALDAIMADYGDSAHLTAAVLVFEVRHNDGNGDKWECQYKSLDRNSPHHLAGIMQSTANWLSEPDECICDEDD